MEDEQALRPHPRQSRRWRRLLLVVLLLLLAALAGLWLARKPLATRYADRFLAQKGVPARYRIADLGFGRQRLVDVVLGDPAHPDLVADWLEARTAVGLHGPYLVGVRGGRVRVRARWADGKLSLGSLDRLLPRGKGGKPFTLPALSLDVDDLRARVETPWGLLGAKLSGSGPLDGGFAGKLAVTGARLATGACSADRPSIAAELRTAGPGLTARVPTATLTGSAEMVRPGCAGAAARYINANGSVQLAFGEALGWAVTADIAAQGARYPGATARSVTGRVSLTGGPKLAGRVSLAAGNVAAGAITAARVTIEGDVVRDQARQVDFAYDGRVGWAGARAPMPVLASAGAGTPIAPLLARLSTGIAAAARSFDGGGTLNLTTGPRGTALHLKEASVATASGATAHFRPGDAPVWTPAGLAIAGEAQVAGGGLPTATIRFAPAPPAGVRGTATVQPYAADGARLALTPVRFAVGSAGWRVATEATLTGPLADGRVEALVLPIDAAGRGGAITLGGGCVPVRWQRVAVSGLVLDPGGVRLCGGRALVTVAAGRIDGGARLGPTRLSGRIGSTPLALATAGGALRLGTRGFAFTGVEARLGEPGRETRLAAVSLDGRLGPSGIAGRFTGAGGQIGAVPLVLSEAAGDWAFAGGTLRVSGGLTVSDAQADRPRFKPLPARDVALTLRGNRIDATATLAAPAAGRTVATLAITHDLAAGTGNATFAVSGLAFDRALQPDQLTPVTFGVVADVRGTVTGGGRIDWAPAGVTSTGSFTTEGTDLAAAFGPVAGITGTIRFTDLLALESAPGQRLHIASVNPGIAVTDGTVEFQTLRDARVQVAGARWPFAGGTLVLEPTLLDFAATAERRLTFAVRGAATDQFLQQFSFENLNATGIFDGVLPMVFDQSGGRIVDGRLAVRPGGGTLAYVGAITQKDVGFWPNLAFQALKSLRYRNLSIQMNGPLAGEMVTEVRFAGISQGEGAKRGGIVGLLVGRLQRLPFVFNIRIRAPFRGLLDATASFYDPRRLIERNLPQLIERQNRAAQPVQPPASETVP